MSLNHAVRHLKGAARLLMLDPHAADYFANDAHSARRSFAVLWFDFPFTLVMVWLANSAYVERYQVSPTHYVLLQMALYALKLSLALFLVFQACRWHKLAGLFPRWVLSFNWLMILLDLLLLPFSLCVIFELLPREQLVSLGILVYFFVLYAAWMHSWRMLKCDIFTATGIALIPVMASGILDDLANLRLFGVARPFFDVP